MDRKREREKEEGRESEERTKGEKERGRERERETRGIERVSSFKTKANECKPMLLNQCSRARKCVRKYSEQNMHPYLGQFTLHTIVTLCILCIRTIDISFQ